MTAALEPSIATFAARDGVALSAAIYKPAGVGPFPTLFAAHPLLDDFWRELRLGPA